MILLVEDGAVVSFEMCRRIERKHMMFVIKLMGKYFAVKCPAECIRQHADVQNKDGRMDKALIHNGFIVYPVNSFANILYRVLYTG